MPWFRQSKQIARLYAGSSHPAAVAQQADHCRLRHYQPLPDRREQWASKASFASGDADQQAFRSRSSADSTRH